MKTTTTRSSRTTRELKNLNDALKGLADEVRVQIHLGTMELRSDAGSYVEEARSASVSAARELVRRAGALRKQFKKIRAAHRTAARARRPDRRSELTGRRPR